MKMMERKAYTAFGEMEFGKMGFGETGFGETGRHPLGWQWKHKDLIPLYGVDLHLVAAWRSGSVVDLDQRS